MKPMFVRQNIGEPVNYLSFLADGSAINFLLWKVLRVKIKEVYTIFYNQLDFSSQPFVTVFVS